MTEKEIKQVLSAAKLVGDKAISKFGKDHQTKKCVEELFELLLAINSKNIDNIVDELADVWLTTLQMAEIHGLDRVVKRLELKVIRLDVNMVGPIYPTMYPSIT